MVEPHEHDSPTIALEAENLAAKVVLREGVDPATLSVALLTSLARERGIEMTLAAETALTSIVKDFRSDPRSFTEVFIRATPPIPGENGYIDWRPGFNPDAPDDQQTEAGDTQVDFYARQTFVKVKKDNHVATIYAPTDGTDGRDVSGLTIPAIPGKSLAITVDPSLTKLGDGRVIGQIDGLLSFDGKTLRVDPVLEIQGTVDFSTGNIDFDGDVVIQRDIRDKFRVKAKGDVTINGLIDASHIECGGDLDVRRGVAGRGEGTLLVGGSGKVGYLDNVTGHVEGSLQFTKELMHSTISVAGDLVSDVGRIIGGRVTVAGCTRVAQLGSASETPTVLRLTSVPEPCSPAGIAAKQVKVLTAKIDSAQREVEVLRAVAGAKDLSAEARVDQLEGECDEHQSGVSALTNQFPQLLIDEEADGCNSTLDVMRQINGRVTLSIGNHTIAFDDVVKGPIRIWLEGTREVMCKVGEGEPVPIRSLDGVTDRAVAA